MVVEKSAIQTAQPDRGQVRGIGRMIDEDRYCSDILQQIRAIRSALARVEDAVLKDHAATCVTAAIESGSEQAQRKQFEELVELMAKVKNK